MVVLHEQWLTRRAGGYRADVPGAMAILCLIAFATGIVDEDVREGLAAAVWGTLGGAVVFGALWWVARRGLRHRLTVFRGKDGVRVRVEGPAVCEEFEAGFECAHGVFVEHIDAYVAARDAPVAWVQLRAADGRTLTVRRALGVQHEVPRWPEGQFREAEGRVFSGDPVGVWEGVGRGSES